MNNYFVYAHVNATTGVIFYIGKGKGSRAKSLHRRSERWRNYVNKYGYDIIYLEENLTQEQSFAGEVDYIKAFGRKDLGTGELINMSDGGVGGNNNMGRVFSQEWINRLKEARSRHLGDHFRGKKHSEESKKKTSESMKGRSNFWLRGKTPVRKKCKHCGKSVDSGNYTQWHGDRCKSNPNVVNYGTRRKKRTVYKRLNGRFVS